MFLSGSFLGVSSFQNVTGGATPQRRLYTKIQVYGSAMIDKLQVKNIEVDNTTLQNTVITDNKVWDPNTLLIAEFENNLAGGNITNLSSPVTNWQVSRTDSSTSVLKNLGTVNASVTQYIDYSAQANKIYTYDVFAQNATQISEPFVTASVITSFFGWYLIGSDLNGTTYVYKMDLEIKSGSISSEEDFTEYPSFTKYNSYAKGERNFFKGSIQALAGDIQSDGSILQTPDYIETLRNRIQDISTKTLKNRKGEAWKIKTHGYNESQLSDAIGQQLYLINFNFIQCEDM